MTPGLDSGSSEAARENNADRKSESTTTTSTTTTATTTGGDVAAGNGGGGIAATKSTESSGPEKPAESQRGRTSTTSAQAGGSAEASTHKETGTSGTSGDVGQPQPESTADKRDGGANAGTCHDAGSTPGGPYCSTRDGTESGNGQGVGKATGKPCAGCVGKADNKNPPGQLPNAEVDGNNGYECDDNNGIGHGKVESLDGATSAGNPAHTGCVPPPTVAEECPTGSTAPECVEDGECPPGSQKPECVDDGNPPPGGQNPPPGPEGNPNPPVIGGVQDFANPRPPVVAGVQQFAGPAPAAAPQASVLPATGAESVTGWLATLGVGLLLMGTALIGLRRHSLVTTRR